MLSTLKNLIKFGAPMMVAVFAANANAQVPGYVHVRSLSWAGSGCPAGSVASNVSPDLQAFTLLFDNYIAQIGPGVPLTESRKNCQIAVDLDFPSGWSYSILTVDYRGYADLESGVRGEQSSAYYFQGSTATPRLTTTMNGPAARDYQIRDTLGVAATVWSPCGASRALNINSQVRLTSSNRNARGMLTVDSIDGQLKTLQVYGLQWRRC